jgi:hypothetical protein
MTCANTAEWTVRFPEVNSGEPFEIRPVEMSLKQERRKFDHFRGTFDWEVGQEMKPHTRYNGGALRSQQRVQVCLDGDPVQAMLFKPDRVDYTDEATYIELVDLQKSLENGTVDKQWDQVKLEDAYEYAFGVYEKSFEDKQKDPLLTDIKFTTTEVLSDELVGSSAFTDTDQSDDFQQSSSASSERRHQIQGIEASDTYQMVDSRYAVDFGKISPAKAIWKLNKKYRLQSWADADGTLWVGTPETTMRRHIAAQDDDRVWHFTDASIKHPREPVQSVVVEGKWVDEPGVGTVDDIVSWFNQGDDDGFGDFRATGIAARGDIDYGLSFTVKNTGAKRDALDTVARLALREEMKKRNSGTVEIDPAKSGDFTSLRNATLGDFLHLVPDDDHWENPDAETGRIGHTDPKVLHTACGNFTHNEVYVIQGIEHELAPEGGWTVHFDIALYPDNPIESFVRYFNPDASGDEQKWYEWSEVDDGEWIESDSTF